MLRTFINQNEVIQKRDVLYEYGQYCFILYDSNLLDTNKNFVQLSTACSIYFLVFRF